MDELFQTEKKKEDKSNAPLADRMRPERIEDIIGQEHILGENGPLRQFFELKEFPSIIFWGPPGVGKTTFALLISHYADHNFQRISAVEAGVKDVRKIIDGAKTLLARGKRTLLFIDEIHRFNKSQQDALLHAVETGVIILVGATTENPSFEVNSALLSRAQVYRLRPLSDENIRKVIEQAIEKDIILREYQIDIEDWDFLLTISGGDARTALNALELSFKMAKPDDDKKIKISRDLIENTLQQKTARYDKKGESHYDTISAFIKTLRGSDPDAALLWLAKMLDAGEDPKFIARRMVIFASEDIGNADPYAITLAVSIFRAVEIIGMPEARINLAQGVTYLASCPKSNASYMGINQAQSDIKRGIPMSVPMHLRNAPAKLLKDEGYAQGYRYPHDEPGHFVKESYFPEDMKPKVYYSPGNYGKEGKFKERLKACWEERY